jgi:8-oxo-dGTP pyrophosphatase MutT (NUDIX family)
VPLQTSPWTIVASREVYSNAWITVVEHDVIRPDGQPGIYGIVGSSLAVGVVPVTDEGNIVLVGQWRVPFDAWSWEIPEGAADPDEDGLTAIKRELQEETGYVAREWDRLGLTIQLSNSHTSEEADVYVARGLTQVGGQPRRRRGAGGHRGARRDSARHGRPGRDRRFHHRDRPPPPGSTTRSVTVDRS